MYNNFVLTVAFRYFSAKKNEKFVSIVSAFSLMGIMIGVAALIVVMSVMNGFHIELTKNIIGLNGDISIKSKTKNINNYSEIYPILRKQEYIDKITPIILGQALAIGPKTNSGALIKGIDIKDLKNKNEIITNVIHGRFNDFSGLNVIAIGSELAHALGAKVGNKIKLISSNTISTAFGSMPRAKEFNIIAIFNSGMYDYDAATILMPLEAATKFLSYDSNINLIEITTKYPEQAKFLSNKLQATIHALTTNNHLFVENWMQHHAQFLNALAIERVAMFTILSLIILVAAFNIISSLFMLVKDKTKDIAILRTIGASTKQIMLIFICHGMLIGLIGTISGIILGTSFAYNINNIRNYLESITDTKIFEAAIYFLYTLPSKVRLEDIILISLLSITLCLLATLYPAYKASRLNPIDALRYE